jgi:hypothetical protein
VRLRRDVRSVKSTADIDTSDRSTNLGRGQHDVVSSPAGGPRLWEISPLVREARHVLAQARTFAAPQMHSEK